MKGLSPTQRTLRQLRQEGYICGIVEQFNPHVGPFGKRFDLFGCLDIIAIMPRGICGIQSCGDSFAEHNRKILTNEFAPEWIKVGGALELWGWRKVVKRRGLKQKIWQPRVKIYTLKDFE